eukprot:g2714.t1
MATTASPAKRSRDDGSSAQSSKRSKVTTSSSGNDEKNGTTESMDLVDASNNSKVKNEPSSNSSSSSALPRSESSSSTNESNQVEDNNQDDESLDYTDSQTDIYRKKLALLKERLADIEAERLPEFVEKCSEFDRDAENELRQVHSYMRYQTQCLQNMYEYNRRAVEEVCRVNKADLKGDLTKEVVDEIKEIEGYITKSKAAAESSRRMSKRNLRSKAAKNEGNGKDSSNNEKRVHDGWEGPLLVGGTSNKDTLRYQISNDSIIDDLKSIHNDWYKTSQVFDKSLGVRIPCEVRLGKFYYGDNKFEFERGSYVVVGNEKSEYAGHIVQITPKEIIVKHNNGSKSRVLVRHLECSRATIRADESKRD